VVRGRYLFLKSSITITQCLLQIEIKLKKLDGIRWLTLELDPNVPNIAAAIPAGKYVSYAYLPITLGVITIKFLL
jgi:hypothetical protein